MIDATRRRALQARRRTLLRRLALPPEGLPGSLSLSRYRGGNPRCHCAQDAGYPRWSLTFMVERKKRVAHIPTELVDTVRARVEQGNAYKRGVAELLAINAQLLILERRARTQQAADSRRAGP